MKNWYAIKAAAQGSDVAEVSILSEIGMWGVNAQQFLAEFRAIEAPNVTLYINSPGGSVFEALAMFNGMRATGKNITVSVLGIAASAASYLAMVGNKVVMPANTYMFLHNPINAVYGNADDMREMADILDKLGASLTATYAKRFTGDQAALDQLMADESYLSAAECLAYGLCDEVTPEITATAMFDVENLPADVQALFAARVVAPPTTVLVVDTAVIVPEALADQVAGLAKDAGLEALVPTFTSDPAITSLATASAVINAAKEIVAFAKHTGKPEMADSLIKGRKTVAEARAALATALAEADVNVDTSRTSPAVTGPVAKAVQGPISLWAEIHAMKAGAKK